MHHQNSRPPHARVAFSSRRRRRATYEALVPLEPGYDAGEAPLPAPRIDITHERRETASLLVLAISRGYAPEDLVDDVPQDVLTAYADQLERDEALAHVDLLLNTLVPADV